MYAHRYMHINLHIFLSMPKKEKKTDQLKNVKPRRCSSCSVWIKEELSLKNLTYFGLCKLTGMTLVDINQSTRIYACQT